jgi:hypothetical protein
MSALFYGAPGKGRKLAPYPIPVRDRSVKAVSAPPLSA